MSLHLSKKLVKLGLPLSALLCMALPASACLIQFDLASVDSPIYLKIAYSASTNPTDPFGALDEDIKLLSVTIADKSELLLAQQPLMDALQQQQQAIALLREVLKQRQEMTLSIIGKLAGAVMEPGSSLSNVAPIDDSYTLILSSSLPGFEDVFIPLSCIGPCEGGFSNQWQYSGYVDEPLSLALLGLGLVGLAFTRRRKQ